MKTLTLPASSFQKTTTKLNSTDSTFTTRLKKEIIHFAQYSYLVFVLLLLLISIVELKHIYKIDLLPGIDTPVDNVYFEGKETLVGQVL